MLVKYSLFDPSGNITALVESDVPAEKRKQIADEIMKAEPSCEQVGFVSDLGENEVMLEMTGGEFCGNATMCAAILGGTGNVTVKICNDKYTVSVEEKSMRSYYCSVCFADLPKGIVHTVLEDEPVKEDAEKRIKSMQGNEARGLMFLNGNKLTPLVYVPLADTLFWENSCASGSICTGKYLFEKNKRPIDIDLEQPGGIINVKANENGIRLSEHIKLLTQTALFMDI